MIHPALGTMDDFQAVIRTLKNRGMQTIISLNFNSIPVTHELAKPRFLKKASPRDKVSTEWYLFLIICLVLSHWNPVLRDH